MEPSIIAYFGTIPAIAFGYAIAVDGCHLIRFIATPIIDGLADAVPRFPGVGDHPRCGVGVGLWRREGRDVVALSRPLRVGRGGGCPALVDSNGEVVIFVDRRISGGDGYVP